MPISSKTQDQVVPSALILGRLVMVVYNHDSLAKMDAKACTTTVLIIYGQDQVKLLARLPCNFCFSSFDMIQGKM